MSAGTKWIFAIVGLLGANLVAMAVLIGAAKADGSHVLPNYYQEAVRYDETIDQRAKNGELGWTASAQFEGGVLAVEVRDREGVRVEAAVSVRAMSRATGAISDGQGDRLVGAWRGLYDVTIRATRGSDTFVTQVVAEAR